MKKIGILWRVLVIPDRFVEQTLKQLGLQPEKTSSYQWFSEHIIHFQSADNFSHIGGGHYDEKMRLKCQSLGAVKFKCFGI